MESDTHANGESQPREAPGERGGLLVVPKDRHVFQTPAPKTSILGLDKLAAQKRAERAEKGDVLGKLLFHILFRALFRIHDFLDLLEPFWKTTSIFSLVVLLFFRQTHRYLFA